MANAPEQLTEMQRACLALVNQGMTSKEIAIRLRLSPATVDTYIKQAMAALKAQNRRDAARMLNDFVPSQNLGSLPEALAVEGSLIPKKAEAADAVSAKTEDISVWRGFLPPPLGGLTNDRNTRTRIRDAFNIALWGVVVFIALILFISQVLRALS